jgi:hypothetical protein
MDKILIYHQIEPHLACEDDAINMPNLEEKLLLLLLLQLHAADRLQQSKITQIVPPNPAEMMTKLC